MKYQKRLWGRKQICFQDSTGCYLEINFRTTLPKQLKPVKTQKSCSNRWIKGNRKPFARTIHRKKNSSGDSRINYLRRPGPDSKVAQIISPRQGTSGKSALEKRKVSPTCFRIDSAKSRKIYSVVKRSISPKTLPKMMLECKSQNFLKKWKKLTGAKGF